VAKPSIAGVVWQFWGRAAEASLTDKSGRFFLLEVVLHWLALSLKIMYSSSIYFTPIFSASGSVPNVSKPND